jgi:hypothetical protein
MSGQSPKHRALTVADPADWAAVNDALDGFEDGIVKEVWLEGGRWLTREDQIAECGLSMAIVVVQLQSASVRSATLRFEGVRALAFDSTREISPARASSLRDGWQAEFLSCQITARACEVELLGDEMLGPGPFLAAKTGG